jgi:ornithine decarboxylase
MTARIDRFLSDRKPETPCLVVDLERIAENYRRLKRALPLAEIHYAVKANPADQILDTLAGLGSNFDAAGLNEIRQCLATGAGAERIAYGNTIKKKADIAKAYELGVRLFAFDSEQELMKLAEVAPGSQVFCRILLEETGAQWPLSRKFGCSVEMARDLMARACELGLDAYGISFHVGSQQTDPGQWEIAIGKVAMLFTALDEAGVELRMVNLGGGFPVPYDGVVPDIDAVGKSIMDAMTRHFGNRLPRMIIEPGRFIAADAGILRSEVVLVSTKTYESQRRWVYLDIGKFGGLAETMNEAIKYHLRPSRGGEVGPVAIAGPTCDGADILYENSGYKLPLELQAGDFIDVLDTGAYTATYASIGFNGFPPLKEYYI